MRRGQPIKQTRGWDVLDGWDGCALLAIGLPMLPILFCMALIQDSIRQAITPATIRTILVMIPAALFMAGCVIAWAIVNRPVVVVAPPASPTTARATRAAGSVEQAALPSPSPGMWTSPEEVPIAFDALDE